MPEIVLTTLNAKFIHPAFGLRYLLANLGELRSQAVLVEYDINQKPLDIATELLRLQPRIIGLGVYLWNLTLSTELVDVLKRAAPNVQVILGGPEVSYQTDLPPICAKADYVICGEADLAFGELCRALLADRPPRERILTPPPVDLERVKLPYELYTDEDLAHRLVYVEASRGCPFHCEFCLSSLDVPLRFFDRAQFLAALRRLLDRGARHFKFVDRSFNVGGSHSEAILEFFLDRCFPGLRLHFEMVPDRLPASWRELLARFPPGTLHLELGLQTFNPEVAERIQRRQDYARIEEHLRFLRRETGAELHADLLVGLPGESWESFGAGFDRLVGWGPQEIQVGLLKRLRGAPMARHDAAWEMVYNPHPPYEILKNKLLDFNQIQTLRQLARVWDLVAGRDRLAETTPLLWARGGSPLAGVRAWADWLSATAGRRHGVALGDLVALMFRYLTGPAGVAPGEAAARLLADYRRGGRSDVPVCLRPYAPGAAVGAGRAGRRRGRPCAGPGDAVA